jgi:hypothetical protein
MRGCVCRRARRKKGKEKEGLFPNIFMFTHTEKRKPRTTLLPRRWALVVSQSPCSVIRLASAQLYHTCQGPMMLYAGT